MDIQKVDMFLMTNAKMLPPERISFVRERLLAVDDEKSGMAFYADLKDPTAFLLISIFLGGWGVDRFLTGDIGLGILKLLTGGLCGILWIVDICTIQSKIREMNFNNLMMLL